MIWRRSQWWVLKLESLILSLARTTRNINIASSTNVTLDNNKWNKWGFLLWYTKLVSEWVYSVCILTLYLYTLALIWTYKRTIERTFLRLILCKCIFWFNPSQKEELKIGKKGTSKDRALAVLIIFKVQKSRFDQPGKFLKNN